MVAKAIAIICLAVLATALLGCSSSPEPADGTAQPSPQQADAAKSGRTMFVANCAGCHGAVGEGQPDWHIRKADGTLPAPPLNGDGHTWHHSDGLLYRIVRDGGAELAVPGFNSGMPPFGEILSQQEIIAVLTYVKSLWDGKTSRGLSISESQAYLSQQDPFPQQ